MEILDACNDLKTNLCSLQEFHLILPLGSLKVSNYFENLRKSLCVFKSS